MNEIKEASIVTYPVRINRETWQQWKKYVARDISMNEAIVALIEKDIAENEKKK